MGKISMTDLAKSLTEKYSLSQSEADAFVADLFDTIRNGLETHAQVKVKGLGTFKTVGVEARESVSVNTGERVTIDSHVKVSFTPDNSMKDIVNKPFSQFETVVLNDGVTFDDMEENIPEVEETVAAVEEVTAEVVPEIPVDLPVIEETPIIEEIVHTETVAETEAAEKPEETTVVETVVEETTEEEIVEEEPVTEKEPIVEEPVEEDEVEDENEESSVKKCLFLIIKVLLIVVTAFGIGYGVGVFVANMNNDDADEQIPQEETVLAPADTLEADTLAKDSIAVVKVDFVETSDSTKAAEDEPEYLKYNRMDKRLRTGAYYIMGTKMVVKTKKADTSRRLAARWIGRGLECYIEVYNGIAATDTLEEGREIKIPKLFTKKYVKDRERRLKEKAKNAGSAN